MSCTNTQFPANNYIRKAVISIPGKIQLFFRTEKKCNLIGYPPVDYFPVGDIKYTVHLEKDKVCTHFRGAFFLQINTQLLIVTDYDLSANAFAGMGVGNWAVNVKTVGVIHNVLPGNLNGSPG